MAKKLSGNFSLKYWNLLKFISGRKKLAITLAGMVCTQFTFDVHLTGLLAGGAVFEGVWSLLEYYLRKIEV